MSDLVLVFETHATSLDNEAGLASGWFDVSLSEKGEVQARALGERRRADNLSAVFCSDLRAPCGRPRSHSRTGESQLSEMPDFVNATTARSPGMLPPKLTRNATCE